MLLTVSGPPGGGKTTTAARLAERYNLEHISGGDIFRSVATERGLSVVELNELAEEDDSIDHELDRRLQQIAAERDDVVLESRLAGWLAGAHADFRFWLDAPREVRVERIADRETGSLKQIAEETERREVSEAARYQTYYDIDIDDRSIYDLAINTGRWDAPAVIDIISMAIDRYDPDNDEGTVRIDHVELPG